MSRMTAHINRDVFSAKPRSSSPMWGTWHARFEQLEDRAVPAVFSVNSVLDEIDLTPGNGVVDTASGGVTLRGAIMESNALAGDDDILLQAATYNLTIAGAEEDGSATGDLDVMTNIRIIGMGAGDSIIDGGQLDRVLHVLAGLVSISELMVRNGMEPSSNGGGFGGGIANENTLTITDCIITGNQSLGGGTIARGGGIYTTGTMTIVNSTISGNLASGGAAGAFGGAALGGGIYNLGALDITGSTISGNTALGGTAGGRAFGGGIINEAINQVQAFGQLTVTNSTISGNSAIGGDGGSSGGDGRGGGICDYSGFYGTATIRNSTITGNQVVGGTGGEFSPMGTAGGMYAGGEGAPPTVVSSIVAGNATSDINADVDGTFLTLGNNLIGQSDGTNGFTNGTLNDQVGTAATPIDPVLGPLADNGGTNQTHALLTGSPAIDAGANPLALTTDQRGTGFTRIAGLAADVGAFEVQSADIAVTIVASPILTTPGSTVTYTITVTNNGPDLDSLVNVIDTFPAELSNITFTSDASAGVTGNTIAGSGAIFDTLSMPSGSSVIYTVTAVVASGASGAIANTVSVVGTFDPSQSNNTAGAIVIVVPPLLPAPPCDAFVALWATATDEWFVANLYCDLFGRVPDAEGWEHWLTRLADGTSRTQVAFDFTHSREYFLLQVADLYRDLLGREPDEEGLVGFVEHLLAGATLEHVTSDILKSDEYQLLHATDRDFIVGLYQDLLGRIPSDDEVSGWLGHLAEVRSRQHIIDDFLHSDEMRLLLIDSYYQSYLDRPAEDEGLYGWLNRLKFSNLSIDQVLVGILDSDEYWFF